MSEGYYYDEPDYCEDSDDCPCPTEEYTEYRPLDTDDAADAEQDDYTETQALIEPVEPNPKPPSVKSVCDICRSTPGIYREGPYNICSNCMELADGWGFQGSGHSIKTIKKMAKDPRIQAQLAKISNGESDRILNPNPKSDARTRYREKMKNMRNARNKM